MMTSDAGDLVSAFELGAMDFIAKPFTALEVIVRARRPAATAEPVVLRGSLAELGVAHAAHDARAGAQDRPALADRDASRGSMSSRDGSSVPAPRPIRTAR